MRSLRVATYNVHHCRGRDGRVDVGRVAATIVACGAEVVALQELDRGMRRSARTDQPALLAELTGMHVAFHVTLRRGGGEFGIALATAEPIEHRGTFLPGVGEREPRGVIVARHRGVSYAATHLAARAAGRPAQLEALAALAARLPSPAVILGDLNERRRGLGALLAAGFVPGPRRVTFPARFPLRPFGRHIDHVLAGPRVRIARARSVRSDASDHRPYVAELVVADVADVV